MPVNTEDSRHFRTRIRQAQLDLRRSLSPARHAEDSQQLCRHLLARLDRVTARPRTIGFCLPMQGEPDILPAMHALLDTGWALSVPVVVQRHAPMRFHAWRPGAALATDALGLPCPDTPACPAPAVLLLPVLAIDRQGFRLGYGGGYFDRTLAALAATGCRPLCIGLGFAQAGVDTIRPLPHDFALDGWVSETGGQDFTTTAEQ